MYYAARLAVRAQAQAPTVGVITCDVTGLGVVVATDSQPTAINEGSVTVAKRPLDRPRLVSRVSPDFAGYLTFVGTEDIGGVPTGTFLKTHSQDHADTPLPEYLDALARDLTEAWTEHHAHTGLYIHIAGAANGEPAFWIVNNIGRMDGVLYLDIGPTFQVANDLDDNLVPQWAARPGESKSSVLARTIVYLRNGSLEGYIEPFDDFNALMSKLYSGRYEGFNRFPTIQAYAALVRMRSEFVARIFNPNKGLYDGDRPLHPPIKIAAVDLEGRRWTIPVKDAPKRQS
jgi:hypothetical protein